LDSVRTLAALRPRAVILSGAWLYDKELAEPLRQELGQYELSGGRVVVIGKSHLGWPRVDYDDRWLGVHMAELVAGLSRVPVLVLPGLASHPALAARAEGFREGLVAGGVAGSDIHEVHTPVDRESAAVAVAEHWDGVRPAAIMAANDILALGALAELTRRGVEIPGQVVLTGIDDIPIARDVDPALTTMALPFAEVGRIALRMALDAADDGHRIVGGRLVLRASTGG
jgi:LacI family transcriptional regulator